MTTLATRDAAQLLWTHWRAGTVIDSLPPGLRPETHAEGHAIQAELPDVG